MFLHQANNYISDDSVHSSGWVVSPSVFLPNTGQSPIREKLSQVLTPAGQTASHKQVGCPQPLLGCFSFVFAFAIDIRLLDCDLLPCPVLTDRVWSFFWLLLTMPWVRCCCCLGHWSTQLAKQRRWRQHQCPAGS